MRWHRIIAVCAMAGVLSIFIVAFTLNAQQQEQYTNLRGKTFSTKELDSALFPEKKETPRTRGIPQTQQSLPSERISVAFDVLYEFNSDKILPRYYANLDKLGEVLKGRPTARLEIEGYTDDVGADDYNQSLSQKRAASVKRYLVQKFSIAPDRLTVVGYGKKKPRATNETSEGRSENRRVEFVNLGQ